MANKSFHCPQWSGPKLLTLNAGIRLRRSSAADIGEEAKGERDGFVQRRGASRPVKNFLGNRRVTETQVFERGLLQHLETGRMEIAHN
jgi:hypothetical protein